jgi:hypothetical protein
VIVRNSSSLLAFGLSETATARRLTEATGIVPTAATEAGMTPTRGGVKPYSRWNVSIESDPEDHSGFGSLRILLSVVLPAADALRALQREYEMRISWGGFSDSSQGGFVLEADLLQGVAGLGIPIYGTTYLD